MNGSPEKPQDVHVAPGDVEKLEAVVAQLQAAASAFAASGFGGFVVQRYDWWGEHPGWCGHGRFEDGVEGLFVFATREDAERYVDASVELEYVKECRRWVSHRDVWLVLHGRYVQRRALLEAHGLWVADDELLEPLRVPVGPGRVPVRDRAGWRVVPFVDSVRSAAGDIDDVDDVDDVDDAGQVRWCESCHGRVGIDVDCDDSGHVHRWVPYRRRSAVGVDR